MRAGSSTIDATDVIPVVPGISVPVNDHSSTEVNHLVQRTLRWTVYLFGFILLLLALGIIDTVLFSNSSGLIIPIVEVVLVIFLFRVAYVAVTDNRPLCCCCTYLIIYRLVIYIFIVITSLELLLNILATILISLVFIVGVVIASILLFLELGNLVSLHRLSVSYRRLQNNINPTAEAEYVRSDLEENVTVIADVSEPPRPLSDAHNYTLTHTVAAFPVQHSKP